MKFYIPFILVTSVVFSSCRKDTPSNYNSTSKVYINVVNKFDGNPIANQDTLMDGSGHSFFLDLPELKMYLSGFKFDNVELDGQALVSSNDGQYYIGEVSPGDYSQISLGIGLDATLNESDPATFESSHPMSIQQGMYWVWATKYRFFKVHGFADIDGDGNFTDGLLYHIGTNDLYRFMEMSKNVSVSNGEDVVIDVEIDWYKFFTNLDISTETNTHTTSDLPLATKLADNALGVISIQ